MQPHEAQQPDAKRSGNLALSRILVVDDDVDYNASLCEALQLDGFTTASAFNARETSEVVQSFEPAIALVDIRLGDDNGIEVIRQIQSLKPDVVCIVITGFGDFDTAVQAVRSGAHDYLQKPINQDNLLATLYRCQQLLQLEYERTDLARSLQQRNVELETINSRLRMIVQDTHRMVGAADEQEVATRLLETFGVNTEAEGGSVYLFAGNHLKLIRSLDPGHAPEIIPLPSGEKSITRAVLQAKKPVLVKDLSQSDHYTGSGWNGYKNRSLLMLPVLDENGEPILLVALHNKMDMHFSEFDREVGELLGSFGAAMLRAVRSASALRETQNKQRDYLEKLVEERTRDLLEAKQRAEDANHEKSRFLSAMSHELRTPLNAIIGFSEIMKITSRLEETQDRERLDHIHKAGLHLLDLISDLLDVSKIESGGMVLSIEDIPLARIIGSAVSMLRDAIEEKQITLSIDCPDNLVASGDERRYLQVLLNLMTNAIKFTPPGGDISIRARNTGNVFHRIEVTDTGIGIDQADIARIFREFQQLDAGRDAGLGGSGIGLSLAEKIVRLHGCDIGVDSLPGEGSTFWFTIPVSTAVTTRAPGDLVSQGNSGPEDRPAKRKRILVAEDNSSNVELLLAVLGHQQLDVQIARNGSEAVALATSAPPDLMLMDIMMPGMDGIAAIRQLKSQPETRDIPIVTLSADMSEATRQSSADAGAIRQLHKPINLNQLMTTINELLTGSEDAR